MANKQLQNLSIISLSEINVNWYFYISDVANFRDARIKVADLFTTAQSTGIGRSLLAASTRYNSIVLKSLNTSSVGLVITDTSTELSIGIKPNELELSNFDNSRSAFLSTVDLDNNVGTSILGVANGGTGADDQVSALNFISNSTGGTANQILKTDASDASWAGIDSIITPGSGLEWDTSTSPYTLNVNLNDVTFSSNIIFNNTVSLNNHNLSLGSGWISNDGGSEGINIDTSGNVFVGTGTAVFDEALTITGNLSFNSGATRSIEMPSPVSGAGDEFQINGSTPSASNQAGGAVTLTGGTGTGTGIGGAINLLAGNSGSGDGDINMSVCDGGTVSQVLKIHGSNKHFTVGSTGVNNGAVVDIQNDTTGAACLELDQNDTDEPFITFTGATAADSTANVSSSSGTSAAKNGAIRLNINGADVWIRTYASAV